MGSDSLGFRKSLSQVSANQGMDAVAEEYINTMIAKVDAYLKGKQPATGIVVQKAKVSDKDNVEAPPGFKMQYTLKDKDGEAAPDPASEPDPSEDPPEDS